MAPPHSPSPSATDDEDGDFEDAVGEPISREGSPKPFQSPAMTDIDPPKPGDDAGADTSKQPAGVADTQVEEESTGKGKKGKGKKKSKKEEAAQSATKVGSNVKESVEQHEVTQEELKATGEEVQQPSKLQIDHSDDGKDEEEEGDDEDNRTPTAQSPARSLPSSPKRHSTASTSDPTSHSSNSFPQTPDTNNDESSSSFSHSNSRPFSLSSIASPPETPSSSSPYTSVTQHLASAPNPHESVGDGKSPSISGAIWRNSVLGNGGKAALVEVNLRDEDDLKSDDGDEGGQGAVGPASVNGADTAESNDSAGDRKGRRNENGGVNGARRSRSEDLSREEKREEFNFLLQRLESQNSLLEIDPKAKRITTEGNTQIRNSFLKMQSESQSNDKSIDWDFWGAVMSNYELVASTQPRELSRAIQQGIPPALRGMTWQLMSASKDQDLETVYSSLLKETSPHEKSIGRDLSRTFPKHEYFQDSEGAGQENLFNVVKAYSLYDEEVGYTQGLQFIVGPLLLNMPDEEAFCVLVRLMKSYDLRSHYTPNMPGLQLRLFQFDRLVEELLPGVFMHLLRQGVKSSMYASQWFLTLFGYRFPLELVSCVFDLVFAEGVEAIFRFSIAILKRNEEKICELEFEHLIEYLKNGLFEAYAPDFDDPSPEPLYKADEFVREALQVKITPLMLDQFGDEWENLCRQQNAHTAEIETLRKANAQLSAQVRGLEASLAQINQEHCDLVRQVVMAKLEREELEDELVKYKIAFADLSHKQESEGAQARLSQDRSGRGSIST